MPGTEPLFELFERKRIDYSVRHVGAALHVFVALPAELESSREAFGKRFTFEILHLHGDLNLQPEYSFLPDDRTGWQAADYVLKGRTGDRDLFIFVDAKTTRAAAIGGAPAKYDDDFARWAQAQAQAIRERYWDHVDTENLAEEIEDLSKSLHREVRSRLRVLIMHWLKWDFQPEQRSGSWLSTIREQQARIEDLLTDSPSLRNRLDEYARDGYEAARDMAALETGVAPSRFPLELPYTGSRLLTSRPEFSEDS